MSGNDPLHLLGRITNCLQTILELEPRLKKLDLGDELVKEFDLLKSFLLKVNKVELKEEDVARIEHATSSFLEELKGPLSLIDGENAGCRFLH